MILVLLLLDIAPLLHAIPTLLVSILLPSFQVYREVARTLAQMHSIQLPEGRRNPGVIIIITIIINFHICIVIIFITADFTFLQIYLFKNSFAIVLELTMISRCLELSQEARISLPGPGDARPLDQGAA